MPEVQEIAVSHALSGSWKSFRLGIKLTKHGEIIFWKSNKMQMNGESILIGYPGQTVVKNGDTLLGTTFFCMRPKQWVFSS